MVDPNRSNASREKWIESGPDSHLSEVARHALEERLILVQYHLPRAGNPPRDAVEHVHQLRVSTRRTASALKVFGGLVSRKRARQMRRRLRGIRQAAGAARDLDVLYMRLGPELVAAPDRTAHGFLGFLLELRDAAQAPLEELCASYSKKAWRETTRGLLSTVCWRSSDPEPTLAEAAHERLVPLIHDFFDAAAKDLTDAEQLHQMRIAGKQLRYALELFGGAYDESLRNEVYPFFIEVQDHLGLINDYVTSQDRLRDWRRDAPKPLKKFIKNLIKREARQYEEKTQEFYDWWTPQKADDLRNRFRQLLEQHGSEKSSALVAE